MPPINSVLPTYQCHQYLQYYFSNVVVLDPSQLFRELDRVGDGEVTAEDFELVMDSAGAYVLDEIAICCIALLSIR